VLTKLTRKEAQGAKDAGADVIVAQGSDAGGPGLINSVSIISLVAEIISAIPGIPVLAAGGISDASGVLAGLALGADAVVMGTRFATSKESAMADKAKNAIIQTRDGGVSTKRYHICYHNLTVELGYLIIFEGRGIGSKHAMDERLSMIHFVTGRMGYRKVNWKRNMTLRSKKRITTGLWCMRVLEVGWLQNDNLSLRFSMRLRNNLLKKSSL